MDIIEQFLKHLKENIELAGRIEQQNQRILFGCCKYCGVKLPENTSLYYCQPDCNAHLAARYKEKNETL